MHDPSLADPAVTNVRRINVAIIVNGIEKQMQQRPEKVQRSVHNKHEQLSHLKKQIIELVYY